MCLTPQKSWQLFHVGSGHKWLAAELAFWSIGRRKDLLLSKWKLWKEHCFLFLVMKNKDIDIIFSCTFLLDHKHLRLLQIFCMIHLSKWRYFICQIIIMSNISYLMCPGRFLFEQFAYAYCLIILIQYCLGGLIPKYVMIPKYVISDEIWFK